LGRSKGDAVTENYFAGPIAEHYDDDSLGMFDAAAVDPAVDFLIGAAGDGPALELAIGTGRLGLPLSARGVPVSGIELSADMVAQLAAKPGSDNIAVTIGDMSTTRVEGAFQLVYLVYNTIENLITQEAQLTCFQNASRHLVPGGCFVMEVEIPQIQRLNVGERIRVFEQSPTRLGFDEIDVATQTGVSHHYRLTGGEYSVFSMPYRYAWPAEFDLMARLAGLSLRERWGDWNRRPFTNTSDKHISVWGLD
jgi:SAM-dependent methyltransferase